MLADIIERLLSTPPIDPTEDPVQTLHWRRRARAVRVSWRPPRDTSIRDGDVERVTLICDAAHTALANHPPVRPGHGTAHTVRVLALAENVIRSDGLGVNDAARLRLAAATHDLGRVLLHDDGSTLRHAEVSGAMLTDLRPALDLPDAVFLPTRYAVLAHSGIEPYWDETSFRVLEDLRGIDRLDALGPVGIMRSFLFYGVDPTTSLTLLDGRALGSGGVLWGWWRMHPKVYPLRIPSILTLIQSACDWGRAVVAAIAPTGDPQALDDLVEDLSSWVEPQDQAAGRTMITRLATLPHPERAAWAALFATVRDTRDRTNAGHVQRKLLVDVS